MRTRTTGARETESDSLAARFERTRQATLDLCRPLAVEDHVVQSMPDASPTKWHLAHTTWFFEEFILRPAGRQAGGDERLRYLFNSYYHSVGEMYPRASRGILSRPTVAEVLEYRARVDEAVVTLLASPEGAEELRPVVELGFAHEEQHQELILTDILNAFACNPLRPTYALLPPAPAATERAIHYTPFPGGIARIGHDFSRETSTGFAFDNEGPAHDALLQPYVLADRPVSNGEYREFVRAGGYSESALWLSDGWAVVQREGWTRPIYWSAGLDSQFSLHGEIAARDADPVCHVSYYEADAFARWSDARLPTEFEWERAAASTFADRSKSDGSVRLPVAAPETAGNLHYGQVWEWTQSPYLPYPGFRTSNRGLGEYNGKFMINQLVLRGGSALTPRGHTRATYRNFFPPPARWQMSGLRLARDR